jgi:hypothetical protein
MGLCGMCLPWASPVARFIHTAPRMLPPMKTNDQIPHLASLMEKQKTKTRLAPFHVSCTRTTTDVRLS